MSSKSCDDSGPSRSSTEHCRDLAIARAGAEFDHKLLTDGGFFAENEKTFLSAFFAPKELLQPGSCLGTDGKSQLSHFKRLPNETMLSVLELVDISSLVTVASVNSHVRALVQTMPDVSKIQKSVYSVRAISRMHTTGTAKHFRLKDLMQAFTSTSCGVCKDSTDFAISFCLLRCCRVCRACRLWGDHQRYLPVEMAEQCFGLDHEEVVSSRGFARVPALKPIDGFRSLIPERARRGTLGNITVATNKYLCVDVIFVRTALTIAIRKYEKYGGMLYVKLLVNDYLMEHGIEFWSDLYTTK